MKTAIFKAMPAMLTVMMLLGVLLQKSSIEKTSWDARPYHRQVKQAVEDVPYVIGEWIGQDVPVPTSAVEMLRANVVLSRRYRHVTTGQQAMLVLVQCSDARDLLGHYPPVCYPSHGWTTIHTEERQWQVGHLNITGMEYQFTREELERVEPLVVQNFMVLPGGGTSPSMAAVDQLAQDQQRKFYGAAQVQLVCSGDMPSDQRDAAFQKLVSAALPAAQVIQHAVPAPLRKSQPENSNRVAEASSDDSISLIVNQANPREGLINE